MIWALLQLDMSLIDCVSKCFESNFEEMFVQFLFSEMMEGIRCTEQFLANCSSLEERRTFEMKAKGALETSTQLCSADNKLRTGEEKITKITFPRRL